MDTEAPAPDPVARAWRDYAEACLEHDGQRAACACAELRRLIPEQPLRND